MTKVHWTIHCVLCMCANIMVPVIITTMMMVSIYIFHTKNISIHHSKFIILVIINLVNVGKFSSNQLKRHIGLIIHFFEYCVCTSIHWNEINFSPFCPPLSYVGDCCFFIIVFRIPCCDYYKTNKQKIAVINVKQAKSKCFFIELEIFFSPLWNLNNNLKKQQQQQRKGKWP